MHLSILSAVAGSSVCLSMNNIPYTKPRSCNRNNHTGADLKGETQNEYSVVARSGIFLSYSFIIIVLGDYYIYVFKK